MNRTIYILDTSTGTDDTTGAANGIFLDKRFTVPTDRYWHIKSLMVTAITSAAVGNRRLAVQIDRDSTADTSPYVDVRSAVDQAASVTRYYNFFPEAALQTAFADTDWLTVPLPDVELPAGWVVRIFDEAAIGTTAAPDDMDIRLVVEQRGARDVA